MKSFLFHVSIVVFIISFRAYGNDMPNKNIENKNIRIEISSTPLIYDLSEKDKTELEVKSLNGDANASFRLYQYYSFTLNDIDEQMRFLKRAACQGNNVAQYNYGFFLSYDDPEFAKYYNLNEAIYWMGLAAKKDHGIAETMLEELKSKRLKKQQ